MGRYWIRIAVIVIVFLAIVFLIASMVVSANTFRPALESELTQALGRQVTLGKLGFSPFSGSLVADNIEIADDPAFNSGPFLEAKSLHIGVKLSPLIFHHRLVVTSFTAVSPSIHLLRSANGVWNFSSIGHSSPSSGQQTQDGGQGALPDLTIGALKISGGSATVASLPQTGKPKVFSNLNLSAERVSMAKNFPFQMSASLPGGGTLSAQGTAGPVDQQDASQTPLKVKIDLNHFDPVAAGVLDPGQGLSMVANIAAEIDSDGKTAALTGAINASRLKLVASGSPAPNPVQARFAIHHNLAAQSGTIDSLSVGTGSATLTMTGSYDAKSAPATVNLRLSAPKVPVDQVESLLPAAGVRLPSGSRLNGGTLTANLTVNGPVNALTIAGPVEIDNTRLAGFNLGTKIQGLKPVRGSESGTEIQTVRANLNSTPSGTNIEGLYASVPALGTATGGGTVSPSGGLNFHILAKLNPGSGVAGEALSGLTGAGGALGSLVDTAASKGIPIDIGGTTSDPIIRADLKGLIKQNASGILQQTIQQNTNRPQAGSLLNKILPH